jgi:hypothetical protein
VHPLPSDQLLSLTLCVMKKRTRGLLALFALRARRAGQKPPAGGQGGVAESFPKGTIPRLFLTGYYALRGKCYTPSPWGYASGD